MDELDQKISLIFPLQATKEAIMVREFLNMIGVVSQNNVEGNVQIYFITQDADVPEEHEGYALFYTEDSYEKYAHLFTKSTCICRGLENVLKDFFGISPFLNEIISYYVKEELYYAFYTIQTFDGKLPTSVRSSEKIEKLISFLDTVPYKEPRKFYTQFYAQYMGRDYDFLLDKKEKRSFATVGAPLKDPIIEPYDKDVDTMFHSKIAEVRSKVFMNKMNKMDKDNNTALCRLYCSDSFACGNYEAEKVYIQRVILDVFAKDYNFSKEWLEKFGESTKKVLEKCPNDLKALEWFIVYNSEFRKYSDLSNYRKNKKERIESTEETMEYDFTLKMLELLKENIKYSYYTLEQWQSNHFAIKTLGKYYFRKKEYGESNSYLKSGLYQWSQIENNPFLSFFDKKDLPMVQETYFSKKFNISSFITTIYKNNSALGQDVEEFRSPLFSSLSSGSLEKIKEKALTFSNIIYKEKEK